MQSSIRLSDIQRACAIRQNDCWVWLGLTLHGKYPKLTVNGRSLYTHRLAFELVHGPLGKRRRLVQECGTELCVNPAHYKLCPETKPFTKQGTFTAKPLLRVDLTPRMIKGFLKKVGEPTPNGCQLWLGSASTGGYGRYHYNDRQYLYAHRVAYALSKGDLEDNLVVDHLCGNRLCVNPEHLEAVTHEENQHRRVPALLRF